MGQGSKSPHLSGEEFKILRTSSSTETGVKFLNLGGTDFGTSNMFANTVY